MKERNRSVLFVFLASVCFSTGGLFIKLIPWNALAINGARNLIGALVIGSYLLITRRRIVFSRRVLISGDSLQEHGHIFMFGERRNMKDYVSSMERLDKMTSEFDEIWPSHGDLPICPDTVRKHCDRARQILNREISGTETEFFGQKIRVYQVGDTAFLCGE